MASWGRAIFFGFLVWLIPFVVSFAIFPLKETWRSLFESTMPVVLSIAVVTFAIIYIRRIDTASLREGAALGALWFGISVLIDLPLMLSPPIGMPLSEYVADIGLTYLMIPVITSGIACAVSPRRV